MLRAKGAGHRAQGTGRGARSKRPLFVYDNGDFKEIC